MKYIPMQTGMWAVFAASFRKNLTAIFGLDGKSGARCNGKCKTKLRADFKGASGL